MEIRVRVGAVWGRPLVGPRSASWIATCAVGEREGQRQVVSPGEVCEVCGVLVCVWGPWKGYVCLVGPAEAVLLPLSASCYWGWEKPSQKGR